MSDGSSVETTTAQALVKAVLNATTKCTKHLTKAASADHDHSSHMSNNNDVSAHNLHDGMVMSFHGGYKETILFDFWKTDNLTIFLISCLALFVMAALYEGLKLVREKLIQLEILKRQQFELLRQNATVSSCLCNNNKTNSNTKHVSHENRNLLNAEAANGNLNDDMSNLESQTNHQASCCQKETKKFNDVNFTKSSPSEENHQHHAENNLITFNGYSSRLISRAHLIQTFLHMIQIAFSYLLMLVFMTYNSWLCLSIVLGAGLGYFFFGLKRLTTIDVNEHCH